MFCFSRTACRCVRNCWFFCVYSVVWLFVRPKRIRSCFLNFQHKIKIDGISLRLFVGPTTMWCTHFQFAWRILYSFSVNITLLPIYLSAVRRCFVFPQNGMAGQSIADFLWTHFWSRRNLRTIWRTLIFISFAECASSARLYVFCVENFQLLFGCPVGHRRSSSSSSDECKNSHLFQSRSHTHIKCISSRQIICVVHGWQFGRGSKLLLLRSVEQTHGPIRVLLFFVVVVVVAANVYYIVYDL